MSGYQGYGLPVRVVVVTLPNGEAASDGTVVYADATWYARDGKRWARSAQSGLVYEVKA